MAARMVGDVAVHHLFRPSTVPLHGSLPLGFDVGYSDPRAEFLVTCAETKLGYYPAIVIPIVPATGRGS